MKELFFGLLFSASFVTGASCAKPAQPPPAPPKHAAVQIAADATAMTCTVDQVSPDDDNVELVCTVPADLSAVIRQILQHRGAVVAPAKR